MLTLVFGGAAADCELIATAQAASRASTIPAKRVARAQPIVRRVEEGADDELTCSRALSHFYVGPSSGGDGRATGCTRRGRRGGRALGDARSA